ncbi:adenylate/guanylate cyclase domain-containing protein [Roseospira marina]|nr:adenylate/guanylate cyclase domain-containing protein [Roseospira marina]MBB4315144.1 adenylate cyclase [Roseospira marina]MBB5088086.1 adenylate cyclase [Roseospira marina]
MPTIAHYEVYTLEDSGWVLHARFISTEKARALEEARVVDETLARPTKVVKETYDTETARYGEQTVYLSARARHARRRGKDPSHPQGGPGGAPVGAGLRPNAQIPPGLDAFSGEAARPGITRFGAPTHAASTSDLIARVIFTVVGSLVLATSGTALIPIVIALLSTLGVAIPSGALSSTLFAVFMVIFLASGFFLTLRFVPMQGVWDPDRPRSRWQTKAKTASKPKAFGASASGGAPPRRDRDAVGDPGPTGATAAAGGDPAPKSAPPVPDPVQAPASASPNATAEAASGRETPSQKEREREKEREKRAEKEREKERQRKKKKENGKAAEDGAESGDAKEKPAEPAETVSKALQTAQDASTAFLSRYVPALKSVRPRIDTYNRFGINLYLAGVCEIIAQDHGLTYGEFERLLRETVEIMGTRPPQASSFVDRLRTYLAEDRYAEMVQHGREAMTLQRTGAAEPFASLGMVVEDWNTPKTQKVTGSTIAIVFTDIVGSTDMTSEYGDIKAQQILRAHNAAVRAALARFSGREIKHTGDGIMATFEHVPDAVWGMIDVLKAVQAHNESQPEIPLRIRIGINAGEPVSAENDYYGLAVTLAARICAQAAMNQILVSQVVRDLCEGTKLAFAEHGAARLKGIKQPQSLHEALWDGAPKVGTNGASSGTPGAEGNDRGDPNPGAGAADADPEDGSVRERGAGPDGTVAPPPPPTSARSDAAGAFDPDTGGWLDQAAAPQGAAPSAPDPRAARGAAG